MQTKIASVGQKIKGAEYIDFCSNKSLSAYDIIVLCLGARNISMDHPCKAIEDYCRHWWNELDDAQKMGKLVFVCLSIDSLWTSEQDFSSVDIIASISNFPGKRPTEGLDIKISNDKKLQKMSEELLDVFENIPYKYVFDVLPNVPVLLTNSSGAPLVYYASLGHYSEKRGHMVFCQDFFADIPAERKVEIAEKFIRWLERFNDFVHKTDLDIEEIPHWLEDDIYKTMAELQCAEERRKNQTEIVRLTERNKILNKEEKRLGKLRALLFAKDKQLEDAVNMAFSILGAEVKEYENKPEALQIDSYIKYNGSILLGDAKGHDRWATNSDISQMSSNRNHFFNLVCGENDDMPKGLVVVNSFRKEELVNRKKQECCTHKALKVAEADNIAIIWAPDLFEVAKKVTDTKNKNYAKSCMEAILNTSSGLVDFPKK